MQHAHARRAVLLLKTLANVEQSDQSQPGPFVRRCAFMSMTRKITHDKEAIKWSEEDSLRVSPSAPNISPLDLDSNSHLVTQDPEHLRKIAQAYFNVLSAIKFSAESPGGALYELITKPTCNTEKDQLTQTILTFFYKEFAHYNINFSKLDTAIFNELKKLTRNGHCINSTVILRSCSYDPYDIAHIQNYPIGTLARLTNVNAYALYIAQAALPSED